MPSLNELNAIWNNLVHDGSDGNNGVGGFFTVGYWSSSENAAGTAWDLEFSDGSGYGDNNKNITKKVRAIRAF